MRSNISLLLCGGLLFFSVCQSFAEEVLTTNSGGTSTNQTYNLDPVFFLLGSTDEYMGRDLGTESGWLEHFYASEESAAKLYAQYLEKALSERSITNGYSVTVSDEGGHIVFYSQEMNQIINSYYDEVPDEMDLFDRGEGVGKLKSNIFGTNQNLKLSYLAGAYSRYGEGNAFYFANSLDKVERIIEEIQYPNCEVVILTRKYTFPLSSTITFEPGTLDGLFKYVTKEKEDANQGMDLTRYDAQSIVP